MYPAFTIQPGNVISLCKLPGKFKEIIISLYNQNVGLENSDKDEFRAWCSGSSVHFRLKAQGAESRMILYRIDGTKVVETPIEAFIDQGHLDMSGFPDNIYILEWRREKDSRIIRIPFIQNP